MQEHSLKLGRARLAGGSASVRGAVVLSDASVVVEDALIVDGVGAVMGMAIRLASVDGGDGDGDGVVIVRYRDYAGDTVKGEKRL